MRALGFAGRPRQWGELWMDLFFSNLFVQFIQVLALSIGVELLQTAGGDAAGFLQFLSGAATLLLVFRIPALVNAAVGGGATSFLGIVALWRGLQYTGHLQTQPGCPAKYGQAASSVPGAARSSRGTREPPSPVRSPRSGSRWPTRRLVRPPGRGAYGERRRRRVRDEAVVRRGV